MHVWALGLSCEAPEARSGGVLAFHDDERTCEVHTILREASWDNSRIQIHVGKTQIWNSAGFVPRDFDLLRAARLVDPHAKLWFGDLAAPPEVPSGRRPSLPPEISFRCSQQPLTSWVATHWSVGLGRTERIGQTRPKSVMTGGAPGTPELQNACGTRTGNKRKATPPEDVLGI